MSMNTQQIFKPGGRRVSVSMSPPAHPFGIPTATEVTPLLYKRPRNPTIVTVPRHSSTTSPAIAAAAAAATAAVTPRQPAEPEVNYHGLAGLDKPASTWTELVVLVNSSVPLSAGLMLQNALNTINILVVGRLGSLPLAVAGSASLLVMVTGYPLPLALAAAFTTITAPIYAQPEHRYIIGHTLQRTLLLSLIASFFVMLFWWNIAPILLMLKQPEDLTEGMKWYMRYAILALPPLGLVETMKSYLQVQGIMHPPPLILLALTPLHTIITIYLVHYTPLAAAGAALAMAVTLTLAGLWLVLYSLRTRARECWDGFHSSAWTNWGDIMWLAVPGALMFGSELWAFEIIALLAGRLGETAVAAQAVISTLDNLVAMVPYAISIGIANRVGNLLGFGTRAIRRARRAVRAGFVLEVLVSGSTGLSVLIFRYKLARIFTDDPEVIEEAAQAAVWVASYQVFDGLQNVGAACLRAFGRQNVGSIIHFFGYYVIGLPFGAWLGLGPPRWGLAGLWAGAALALAVTSAAELLFAFTIKWEAEIERVRERGEDSDEDEEYDSAGDGENEPLLRA